MKKIKRFLFIFLCFVFFISIINIGRVFATSNILKVTNAVITEKSADVDASILGYTNNTVSSNVSYHRLNDYTIYKITIKNTDSIKHVIDVVINNNTQDYLEYEYDNYRNTVLKPNEYIDIYIKEIYRNEYNNISNRTLNNTVRFTFDLIDERKNESTIDIIINPNTGDSVNLYVALAAASFISILLLLISRMRRNKKAPLFLLLLPVIFMFVPVVSRAIDSRNDIYIDNAVNILSKLQVTYSVDDTTRNVVVDYGKTLNEPTTPTKDGYTFKGWYLNGERYDFTSTVKEDLLLTAEFERNTYNITYDLKGGSAKNPNSFKITELPITLNNPSKEGYTFTGWTGSNGTRPKEKVTITEVSEDLSYVANYSVNNYKIKYVGLTSTELETVNNPTTYTIVDNITLTNPTNRLDSQDEITEKFIGWRDENGDISTNITIANFTGNKTYEAIWQKIKADTYTITYNLNNGTVDGENPTEFNGSTKTFTLINPTRNGYTFLGWIGSNGNVPQTTVSVERGTTRNLSFEAVFEIDTYTITYNMDGATNTNPLTYTVNDEITLVNPTKEGYTFDGWSGTGISGKSKNVTIPVNSTGDREYSAHFTIDTYTITYLLHDGVVETANPTTYTINDTFTLNNPSKEGYTFKGWSEPGTTGTSTEVTVTHSTGNKTFEAIFTVNPYTVKFDKNDESATGTMADMSIEYGESVALTKNVFRKTGYGFVKWNTKPDGSGTDYSDQAIVSNLVTSGSITLYAQWKVVRTSTFDTGKNVNVKMKKMACNSSDYTAACYAIKKVLYSNSIPDYCIGDTNYIVSDSSSTIPIYMWFENGNIYYGSEADILYTNKDASYMYNLLTGVTEIENNYETSKTTKMVQMYYQCQNLTTNEMSHFDTSNVTTMNAMFGRNYSMTSYNIKSWDVHNVSNFSFMFNENTILESLDLRGWNTIGASNMQNMFSSMYALTDLKIDTFDTRNVTIFTKMFDNERAMVSLDLSNFNTSSGTNMWKMFYNMYELKSLNITSFNTSNVTNMQEMFIGTRSIETLDLSSFNTAKVSNFNNMFKDMSALKTIYVSDGFVTSGITSTPSMFSGAESLVGGAGTTYSSSHVKSDYAHIDGGPSNPGYFTRKE